MFKFDFGGQAAGASPAEEATPACEPLYKEEAREMAPGELINKAPPPSQFVKICEGLQLLKGSVTNSKAAALLGVEEVALADLIPGAYEGGFKLWECALDLAQLVAQELCGMQLPAGPGGSLGGVNPAGAGNTLQNLRVLELGCGHGLPGITALLGGAEVHFQDYNREVLHSLTAPNVQANWQAWQARQAGGGRAAQPGARYFCGSWDRLSALLLQLGLAGSYDVVLSAETIYSPAAAASLLACIKGCLKQPGGVAYIAAKSYYFGVGGGTAAFRQLVQADSALRVEGCRLYEDGASNRREILRLAWNGAAPAPRQKG